MSLPTNSLDLAIHLQQHVRPESMHGRQVELAFPISGLDFHETVKALSSSGLLIDESAKRGTIEYQFPPGLFINLDELLISPSRRLSPPEQFYIVDSGCHYKNGGGKCLDKIKNYFIATQLASALMSIADYQGGIGSAKTIVFLGREKLEISIDYTVSDLSFSIDLSEFTSTYLDSEIHREQKKTIIKTVLFEMFSGRENIPFSSLLIQFNDFMKKIHASYQLYVAEFSFEKVKEQIEKEKLEATMKLNKVFSDIQNQLLAVPAALILAGGQMVQDNGWNSKNISLWLGVVILSIFMTMLIRNQRNTLQAVKKEIDQQWLQLEGKYHSVASRFKDSYQQLDDRHSHQEWLIKIISFLVSVSLFITTILLLIFSVETPTIIISFMFGFGVALFLVIIERAVYHIKQHL
ncbi:hypothetical protein [Aeromonas veronii]|uniref:hypothetical protein n=1 Tax=Aeromonas veronii TaxID=654 RepID=UPI003B9FD0EE